MYIAEDYNTAFEEAYHSKDESIGDFSHYSVEGIFDEYLVLREKKVIEDFFETIRHIQIPKEYDEHARSLNVDPIDLCSTAEQLEKWIFSPGYKAWDTWIDQFAPSQWLGYYCYRAKIHALVYPSVRKNGKFNIAVFYENFEGTNCEVKLQKPQEWPHINEDRKTVDASNFAQFLSSIA